MWYMNINARFVYSLYHYTYTYIYMFLLYRHHDSYLARVAYFCFFVSYIWGPGPPAEGPPRPPWGAGPSAGGPGADRPGRPGPPQLPSPPWGPGSSAVGPGGGEKGGEWGEGRGRGQMVPSRSFANMERKRT